MFRSDFTIIIKRMHLYVDDHREAVMVCELCIAIDEKCFTVLQLKKCVIWLNTYTLYKYMKLHLYMVFHDDLSCALPMIIYIYYRFIVRFPIGLDFLFITFTILLHLLLSWTSSLSISSSAISTSNTL